MTLVGRFHFVATVLLTFYTLCCCVRVRAWVRVGGWVPVYSCVFLALCGKA